jgi:uncharacterized membrane protein YgcG
MPFVPLSTDGTQLATTETLRAPRVQVALEPHEAGVTVLAIEPRGLRAIGQLDLAVADGYRRVLAPLAADGLYGICIAESTDTGTVLCLAPPECCLPAGDWPWRPAAGSVEDSAELAAWLAAPAPAEPDPAPAPAAAPVGMAAPGAVPRRSAHRRPPRPARVVHRRAAAPWILAGVIALLMAGAVTQALTGQRSAVPAALAAVDTGDVPVPGWAQSPPATEPPVVDPAPAAAEPVAAAPPPVRPAAPKPEKPAPAPAPAPAPKHDEHEATADDARPARSDSGESGGSGAKQGDSKSSGSSSSGSGSGGSGSTGSGSNDSGKGSAAPKPAKPPAKDRRPGSFSDLLRQLAEHSGNSRPRFPAPHFGR